MCSNIVFVRHIDMFKTPSLEDLIFIENYMAEFTNVLYRLRRHSILYFSVM